MSESQTATARIRTTLRASDDPRPSRTKNAIVAAVRTLGDASHPVSVPAIVATSGVSRSSFYAHFESLDAVALFVFEQGFTQIENQRASLSDAGSGTSTRQWVALVVDHYVANRALYAAVLTLPSVSHEVHTIAVRRGAEAMLGVLAPSAAAPNTTALMYTANGFVAIFDAWLLDEMRAAGVCRTDLSAVTGSWPTAMPPVLGHGRTGEAIEAGTAVQHIRPGQHVILAALAACNRCYYCLHGQPYLCELNDLEGTVAPTFDIGGIGSSAIQGARLAEAGIILAVDPATGKHCHLKQFGATHTATPEQLDTMIAELTAGRGFDHSFENVGRPETIRSAWHAARRGGEVIITGLGAEQRRSNSTHTSCRSTLRP